MGVLEVRTFDSPDETIPLGEKVRAECITVGGVTTCRFIFEPGWRFTRHSNSKPCDAPHAGYIAAGRLRIVMNDGSEAEAGPGAVVTIDPGHDAWTIGDEPCVLIDFARSVTKYAADD